ncbi:MAG: aldehyde dehydrogenase (NADP(+)) [Fimbriimonadaceae bacterium]|nr:MAG: aldehyde dehydrogenase (NADP(+)) [Fimbriimonadaceae bacterium]
MPPLLGSQLIGSKPSRKGDSAFRAVNPETGKDIHPEFMSATEEEVNQAVDKAVSISRKFQLKSGKSRAAFLRRIAEEIELLGEELIERAVQETGLPSARIAGERARTCGQLRMFADVAEEGSWVDARIELELPDRQPVPRPDLRRMLFPLGPIAVFGASNFPLAFSVAGGDTASAFAAGCPVIAKAHPSHPGTSELVGRAIVKAAVGEGMPDGVFSLLQGGKEVGAWLAKADGIEAIGFTGSLAAGRALSDLASKRLKPIPVFAEMGSVNPVFVLPGAMAKECEEIATGFANSLLMGVGQFCTNPGLLIGVMGDDFDQLVKSVAQKVKGSAPGVMLNQGIAESYGKGVADRSKLSNIQIEASAEAMRGCIGSGVVFSTSGAEFLVDQSLQAELFGPATLVVKCNDLDQLVQVVDALEGQLTGTIFHGGEDSNYVETLAPKLAKKVGRIIFNGYPTGVEVGSAMQHGGPYPATTDSRFTSVGTAAILRWARPITWQNAPEELLPPELQNDNPHGIWRQTNGVLGKD